jgi:hypothetical protein
MKYSSTLKRDCQHLEGFMVVATGYICLRTSALQMHLLAQRKTSDGTKFFRLSLLLKTDLGKSIEPKGEI